VDQASRFTMADEAAHVLVVAEYALAARIQVRGPGQRSTLQMHSASPLLLHYGATFQLRTLFFSGWSDSYASAISNFGLCKDPDPGSIPASSRLRRKTVDVLSIGVTIWRTTPDSRWLGQ
jgi:hypothetical protein